MDWHKDIFFSQHGSQNKHDSFSNPGANSGISQKTSGSLGRLLSLPGLPPVASAQTHQTAPDVGLHARQVDAAPVVQDVADAAGAVDESHVTLRVVRHRSEAGKRHVNIGIS